jgi:hypothetical protein
MGIEAQMERLASALEENNQLLRALVTNHDGLQSGLDTAPAEPSEASGEATAEPAQGDTPAAEAEAAAGEEPTLDDLKQAVKEAAKTDRDATVAVLQQYGASKATEVPEEQYGEAVRQLKGVTDG